MKGAHDRIRNMSRLHFTVFVFGLCLFGLGVGILSANVEVSRVSVTTTTTAPPATTIASAVTEPPVTVTKKPIRVTSKVQIGTAMSIARETTTTTSTESPKTPLAVAQSQVGKTGPYAEGGFYCAKFASWVAEQAEVRGSSPPMARLLSTRMPSPMGGLPISQLSATWCSSTSSVPEASAMAR
jgi:hypothetical protein